MAEGYESDPIRPDRSRWLVAVLLVGAGAAVALQLGKAVGALPAVRADLGLSLVAGGWVVSAVNLAGGLFGLLVGASSDRFGHRRTALAGLTIAAVCGVVGATAHAAPILLATRIGEGLGFVLTVLAAPTLLLRVTAARDHGVAFGFWSAYLPVGTGLAVVATPLVLGHWGWRGLWLASAGLTAGWALLLAAATRDLRPPARRSTGPRIPPIVRSVITSPGSLLAAGIFFAHAFQFLTVVSFLPIRLPELYRITAATATTLTATVIFANVGGTLIGGWLRGRGVAGWLLICASSAVTFAAVLGVYAPDIGLAWRIGCCLIVSLVGGLVPATLLGAVADLAPSPHALAATVGVITQGSTLGLAAGPPMVAALATATGDWEASPVPLGLAATVAVVLALRLRRLERTW